MDKDVEDILLDNLKEALKQFQNYLIWGIGASLTFFLLTLSNSGTTSINIPSIGSMPPIDVSTAKLISLSVYWIVGFLGGYAYERAERISLTIMETSPTRLKAMLTYPSIATESYPAVRILAVLTPMVLIILGFIVRWHRNLNASTQIIAIALLFIPYLTIIVLQLKSKMPLARPEKIKIHR